MLFHLLPLLLWLLWDRLRCGRKVIRPDGSSGHHLDLWLLLLLRLSVESKTAKGVIRGRELRLSLSPDGLWGWHDLHGLWLRCRCDVLVDIGDLILVVLADRVRVR